MIKSFHAFWGDEVVKKARECSQMEWAPGAAGVEQEKEVCKW